MTLFGYLIGFFLLFLTCNSESPQDALEFCDTPRNHTSPTTGHIVIFDVGSTGTRAHIYGYDTTDGILFMPGWSRKIRPGFATVYRSIGSEYYLDELRDYVYDVLGPTILEQGSTIFLLRATGGFRLLSSKEQEKALNILYNQIVVWKEKWNLRRSALMARENAIVLRGEEEGALSWLALNQLARRFKQNDLERVKLHPLYRQICSLQLQNEFDYQSKPLPGGAKVNDNWLAASEENHTSYTKSRVGMIEVGGASTQVVIETDNQSDTAELKYLPNGLTSKGGHNYVLTFNGHQYKLGVLCLEGFGREAAFMNFLRFESLRNNDSREFETSCLPPSIKIPLEICSESLSDSDNEICQPYSAIAVGRSNSTASDCLKSIRSFFSAYLSIADWKVNISDAYRIYATENFYYFNQYVAKANNSLLSPQGFWVQAERLCQLQNIEEMKKLMHIDAGEDKKHTGCFGLIFLSELLKSVLGVRDDQLVKAVTAVKNLETGFIVGAALMELSSNKQSFMNEKDEL